MATEKVPPVRNAAKAAIVKCCEALREAQRCEALHVRVVQRREGVPALCEAQRCEALREQEVQHRKGVPQSRDVQRCEALHREALGEVQGCEALQHEVQRRGGVPQSPEIQRREALRELLGCEALQRGVQHREGVARSRDADVQRRGVERRGEVAQCRVQSRGVRDDKSRAAARISDLSAPSFSRLVFSSWSDRTTFF